MNPAAQPRVAAVGCGVLSPAGTGVEAYLRWDAGAGRTRSGQTIPDFEPAQYITNIKLLRSMHRTFQVVAASAVLALRAADLPTADSLPSAGVRPERTGIATALGDVSPLSADLLRVLKQSFDPATGVISWSNFAELSLHQLHPFRRLTLLANMAAAHTSLLFGLQGPSFTFTAGGPAGSQAVMQAYWTVAGGRADMMVCQAADCPQQSFLSSPRAETGAALVLEEWQSAQRRGAPILAEILPPAAIRNPHPQLSPEGSPTSGLLAVVGRLQGLASAGRSTAGIPAIPLDRLTETTHAESPLEQAS